MPRIEEYLLFARGDERMLLHLEAETDDFLDLLNALRGRGYRFEVIGRQQYRLLKDTGAIPAFEAK